MAGGEQPDPLPEETVEYPEAISPAQRIRPYQILETLGEGGMAVVYLAEQKAPVRRRVWAMRSSQFGMRGTGLFSRGARPAPAGRHLLHTSSIAAF